tara:strand:+ start:1684 stop:2763 length:1080 start_codon:yes stop_codon:yes gene_type:complete
MGLVPKHIKNLSPYVPGMSIDEVKRKFNLTNIVKLASNENPLGPSPKAIKYALEHIDDLHRYPDAYAFKLRTKLANIYNIKIENVILGGGSEGIMSVIMRTFLHDDDEIVSAENSFIGFRVLANASGIKTHWVPMNNYHYDLDGILSRINDKTKVIYLANPDNPTGTYFKKSMFDAFIKRVPNRVLVILDEAYFEYACHLTDFPDSMIYKYDNVITLRTFSKAYGLAGLRIGYGFGHQELIDSLMKVKLPFEPSSFAQMAGLASLEDDEFLAKTVKINASGMQKILNSLKDYDTIPSVTNFITIKFNDNKESHDFTKFMLSNGVIVRNLKGFGLEDCVRISIGTEEENDFFCDVLYKMK